LCVVRSLLYIWLLGIQANYFERGVFEKENAFFNRDAAELKEALLEKEAKQKSLGV
jgi:hypothetical protein